MRARRQLKSHGEEPQVCVAAGCAADTVDDIPFREEAPSNNIQSVAVSPARRDFDIPPDEPHQGDDDVADNDDSRGFLREIFQNRE